MRKTAAWALFLAGDLVSQVMNLHDWLGVLYPTYNRLMNWSSAAQGPSGNGPWSEVVS